jgi:hypothetical protein
MIEVIVGAAILGLAITMGNLYIQNVQNAKNMRKHQTTIRFLAIQATMEATINYPFYPPVVPPSPTTQPLYVACFTAQGDKVSNATPTKSRDFQFYVANNYDERLPSGACDKANTKFEVRFFWTTPFQSDININIVNLWFQDSDSERFLFKNFKIFAK